MNIQHEKYKNDLIFLQESQCQRTGIPLILQHFGYIVKTRKDCQFTLSLTGTA